MSDRTSLILTHEREEGDKAEGLPKVQHVPQMPAFGHGCYVDVDVDICSFLPMRQGVIDPAVYKNRYKDNADMVRRIVEIWSNGQYQFTTASNEKFAGVCKFLEDVRIETGFDEVWEFLDNVRTETGLSQEQVWAVFMEWALEKTGKGADRHSLRLLRATQAGVTLENANAMRLRFEAWAPSL